MERDDVSALVQVLVARGYDREARAMLLGGLDPRIRGALPGLGRPTDQALSDVQSLLRYGEVGQHALAALIQNLVEDLLDPASQATLVRLHIGLVGTAPILPAPVASPPPVPAPVARKEAAVRKILFLGANPVGQRLLRIAEEAELIRRELVQSPEGRAFKIEHRFAATYPELQRALLDEQPEIVHISCHGVGGDLVFSDDANRMHTVGGDAVADMIKLLDSVRGCLIMACESGPLAEQVATDSTLFAVGLSDAMSDGAVRAFSASFYLGLARGLPVALCHKLGKNAVKAMKVGEEALPVLFGA